MMPRWVMGALVALISGCALLDGGRGAAPPPRPRGPVEIESFAVVNVPPPRVGQGTFAAELKVSDPRGVVVVVRTPDGVVSRQAVADSSAEIPLEIPGPGEYRADVEVDGKVARTVYFAARTLECATVDPVLVLTFPPRVDVSNYLIVGRANPIDRDPAYLVEWVHDGEVLYHDLGRAKTFDDAIGRVEGARDETPLLGLCAFTSQETYAVPDGRLPVYSLAGRWEIRIHREGQPSIAVHFDVSEADARDYPQGKAPLSLAPDTIETPSEVKTLLSRVPTACDAWCASASDSRPIPKGKKYYRDAVGDPGYNGGGCAEQTPPLPHKPHVPGLVASSAAEVRAIVRSREAVAARIAVGKALQPDDQNIERPSFAYDDRLTADQNRARERAWEAHDNVLEKGQLAEGRTRAAALVPALRAAAKAHGAHLTGDEAPTPPRVGGW